MGKDLLGEDLGKGFSQRKDGLYLARRKTKQYDICLTRINLEELRTEFARAVAEAERKAFVEKNVAAKTVDDWFYTWLEIFKKPTIRTWKLCAARYRNSYGKYIGKDDIVTITPMYLQMISNKLVVEDLRSPEQIRGCLRQLKECFESAVANRVIQTNPAVAVSLGTSRFKDRTSIINCRKIKFLKREEQDFVISYLKETKNWYFEMIMIMLLHGLRIGEIGGLCWKDIDLQKQVIHIQRAIHCEYDDFGGKEVFLGACKTDNSERELPFSDITEQIFASQLRKIKKLKKNLGMKWRENDSEFDDLVFWTRRGSPVTRYSANRAFANLKKKSIMLVN